MRSHPVSSIHTMVEESNTAISAINSAHLSSDCCKAKCWIFWRVIPIFLTARQTVDISTKLQVQSLSSCCSSRRYIRGLITKSFISSSFTNSHSIPGGPLLFIDVQTSPVKRNRSAYLPWTIPNWLELCYVCGEFSRYKIRGPAGSPILQYT